MGAMKIVAISDTHLTHNFKIPDGDVLVHAGDLSVYGSKNEVSEGIDFLKSLPHEHKIFISGNHDLYLENLSETKLKTLTQGIHYLCNSAVDIDGVKFYGSPWTPHILPFQDHYWTYWGYNLPRRKMKEQWAAIPLDTKVLITHGPPRGVGDRYIRFHCTFRVGCSELRKKVAEIKPRLHIFGHAHDGYGLVEKDGTIFANASICHYKGDGINKPLVVNL
jgi:Icc-related predicted phosphoesterase